MSREKQIEDQSEILYGGRRKGGKRFAEMCAKAFENAEAHPENYDEMFAGYENNLNKAVALIEWQKQEIESLTIRMNALGLAVKSLAEERGKYFLRKENGEVVPLVKQAEWSYIPSDDPRAVGSYMCSRCKCQIREDEKYRMLYCPNCGAKMKGA